MDVKIVVMDMCMAGNTLHQETVGDEKLVTMELKITN